MQDKVILLMEETGCDRGEAELALELCGYDVESAVSAIPRLFQNIAVFKGRLLSRGEALYGLWLAILNLKERSVLRVRAVVSYNPAVYASELDRHWFDFEARLYACRLWAGSLQAPSQEVEQLLATHLGLPEAAPFYEEGSASPSRLIGPLKELLVPRLGEVDLQLQRDLLDMGQYREVRPPKEGPRPPRRPRAPGPAGPGRPLVLKIALEPAPEGLAVGELRAGDFVYATITDSRDIAQYLAKLFGGRSGGGNVPLLVPVEAVEKGPPVTLRVRFSAGVCGDVELPRDIRLKAVRRPSRQPWWKKLFGKG